MNVREPPPTGYEEIAPLSDVQPPSRRLYFLVAVAALGALAWGAYGRWQQRAAAIETQPQIVNFVPEVRVSGKTAGRPGVTDAAGYRAPARPGSDLRPCHRICR
jgi:hypothetical protein